MDEEKNVGCARDFSSTTRTVFFFHPVAAAPVGGCLVITCLVAGGATGFVYGDAPEGSGGAGDTQAPKEAAAAGRRHHRVPPSGRLDKLDWLPTCRNITHVLGHRLIGL